jgi:RHS repeat-associated protein
VSTYDYDAPSCTYDGAPLHVYKFTGKERDTESGLDEFGARYYSSSLGRFMIPDWAGKPTAVPYASFGNPQSLNLYSYVNNNPTTTRDPDGHCLEDACVIEGGIVVTAMAVAYLSSPPGQQMLHNAASSITSIGSAISGFFHPQQRPECASASDCANERVARHSRNNADERPARHTCFDLAAGSR